MAADNRHWTTCTTADNIVSVNQYIAAAITTGPLGVAMVAVAIASGEPWCWLIAIEVTAIVWVLAYCDWWLNYRLVCLGGTSPEAAETVSAVGMAISVEPPSEKTWPGSLDSDYSVNLLLPNDPEGVDQATATSHGPYGQLIAENVATKSHGLLFTGNQAEDKETKKKSEALHIEFEGASIHDLQTVNQIALAAALVALALCMTGIGAVAAYVLAFLAFLASLFGAAFSPSDTGSPSDAGLPSIGLNKADGKGANLLGVTGMWVYDAGHIHDSFHEGHNEIHPVLQAQIIGPTWDGDWPPNIDAIITDYGNGYDDSRSAQTQGHQARPGSLWAVHPDLDGCAPRPDIR
jgi:hypothetical protein